MAHDAEDQLQDGHQDHHQDHQPEKVALDSIMQYARTHDIQMHASIAPYHFPRHGLGICAAGAVKVCSIKFPVSVFYAPYPLPRLDFGSVKL
jgi:hypothetical protein